MSTTCPVCLGEREWRHSFKRNSMYEVLKMLENMVHSRKWKQWKEMSRRLEQWAHGLNLELRTLDFSLKANEKLLKSVKGGGGAVMIFIWKEHSGCSLGKLIGVRQTRSLGTNCATRAIPDARNGNRWNPSVGVEMKHKQIQELLRR